MQPRPYNDKELEFKSVSMMQLSELSESIKEMHVQLPVEEVTRTLIDELAARVRESKGQTVLRLNLYDRESQVSLNLFSKSYKVGITRELVSYLDDHSIRYSIM